MMLSKLKERAKPIDEIANSKLMDELNCNGEVNNLNQRSFQLFVPTLSLKINQLI